MQVHVNDRRPPGGRLRSGVACGCQQDERDNAHSRRAMNRWACPTASHSMVVKVHDTVQHRDPPELEDGDSDASVVRCQRTRVFPRASNYSLRRHRVGFTALWLSSQNTRELARRSHLSHAWKRFSALFSYRQLPRIEPVYEVSFGGDPVLGSVALYAS
jgi:hypothetical protein